MRLIGLVVVWRVVSRLLGIGLMLVVLGGVLTLVYHAFPFAREVMDTLGHAGRLVLHYINQHLKGLS